MHPNYFTRRKLFQVIKIIIYALKRFPILGLKGGRIKHYNTVIKQRGAGIYHLKSVLEHNPWICAGKVRR